MQKLGWHRVCSLYMYLKIKQGRAWRHQRENWRQGSEECGEKVQVTEKRNNSSKNEKCLKIDPQIIPVVAQIYQLNTNEASVYSSTDINQEMNHCDY